MCLAVILCEQFCRFANGSDKISIKSYFMRSFFLSQCIQQQYSVRQNYFLSELTADCSLLVSGRKERKLWSQPALACFMLKATSVPQTPQTNHSQYSSPVEALNLIVDWKSQPFELDNSTIELHVPSRRKKSLQSVLFCGFWFLCFNAIWYDLWCHVACGRPGSSIC